jgi:hypothetical protein
MAYMNKENATLIRNALKVAFPNIKFAVRKDTHSIHVTIASSDIDFSDLDKEGVWGVKGYAQINQFHLHQYGRHETLLAKIVDIIKTAPADKWYDRSDSMSDYFDTAFYIHLNVGAWDKPYVYVENKQAA